MKKPFGLALRFFFHEPTVYLIFCTGIIYSMFLWPLLNSILCIALGAYWLFFTRKSFFLKSLRFRLVLLFISLFLLSVIGLLYSANLHDGAFRMQQQTALLLFPVALGFSEVLNPKMVRTLLTHFILATIFTAVLGFVWGCLHYHAAVGESFDSHSFVYPGSYSYIMALNCLLSLIVIAEKQYDRLLASRWLIIPAVFVLSAYLLLLNVRLLSACWLAMLLYYVYHFIPRITHRLVISLAALCLIVLAFFKIPFLRDKWTELKSYPSRGVISLDKDASLGRSWGGTSIRLALWSCSEELIDRHPLTGVGTGDVQDSLQQAYENRKFYFASRYNRFNIHNQYLHMMLAFGVFGVAILLACMAAPAIFLYGDPFARTRRLFLLLFFLICFTEVILGTNKGIIWYSFFNSIFAFGGTRRTV